MQRHWMKALVPAALLVFVLAACGGGGTVVLPTVTGVSVELADPTIAVDALTSASATVAGSAGVSQAVTWSSSDPAVATVTLTGQVRGQGEGQADIIATSQVDGTKSGSAEITVVATVIAEPPCNDAQPLSGPITVDTTVTRDCYDVSGTVSIQGGATLTIEPGAILRFASNSGIRVETDSVLVAAGTAAEPIVLRGATSVPGSWFGLFVTSNRPENALSHVVLEDAGLFNTTFHGSAQSSLRSGVRLGSGARLAVSDSTFRNNDNTGIRLADTAIVSGFANNSFEDNVGTPMIVTSKHLGMLDADSDYGGAGHHIAVAGSTVTVSADWPAINVPYRLSGITDINDAGAAITVVPGATFEGSSGSGIRVVAGSFSAKGTATDRIVFRGVAGAPSSWFGLFFESNNLVNALEYVTVSDAGQLNTTFHRSAQSSLRSGVRLGSGARLAVSNSTFRNNDNTGIRLADTAIVNGFANNTFEDNVGTPMIVTSKHLGMLDADSDYGEAGDYIDVAGTTVTTSANWPAINVPYRLSGRTDIDNAGAAITVAPGATFEGTSAAGIRIVAGSFSAKGTATDRIVFRGVAGAPGSWLGLFFESNNLVNALEYVTVSDAGQLNTGFHRSAGNTVAANVRIAGGARLELNHSLIRNSALSGLLLAGNGTSVLVPANPFDTNTFEGNNPDVTNLSLEP